MNDPLDAALFRSLVVVRRGSERIFDDAAAQLVAQSCARAVRAYLALPPSEEEIEAAAEAAYLVYEESSLWSEGAVAVWRKSAAAALMASRAVLVPSPEGEKP